MLQIKIIDAVIGMIIITMGITVLANGSSFYSINQSRNNEKFAKTQIVHNHIATLYSENWNEWSEDDQFEDKENEIKSSSDNIKQVTITKEPEGYNTIQAIIAYQINDTIYNFVFEKETNN